MTNEIHPFEPFLPHNARVLILGSFPPTRVRWCMDFFYPNFQNDMWRIMGLIFYGDKNHFVVPGEKRFDKEMLERFCNEKGIALFDTATEVTRLKDNAADKFLQIERQTDIVALLRQIPYCKAIIVTGDLAASTLSEAVGCTPPSMGQMTEANVEGRIIRIYRMPSSSRAYPMKLETKAGYYKKAFDNVIEF